MHRTFVKTSVLALTGAAVLVAGSMGGAVAARMIGSEDIRDNSILQEDLRANSVGNAELQADAVGWGNIDQTAQDRVRSLAGQNGADGSNGLDGTNGTAGTNGAAGAQGPEGPVGPMGPEGAKGEPGNPASDVFGEYAAGYNGSATVGKIGGSYTTNATTLGTFTVTESGKYLVSAYGFFDRLNEGAPGYEAPTTDTYLQLSVRGGTVAAQHPGTCFTPAVSAKGFTETTCQSVQVIEANAGDTFTVRAFGYNEDRSGFGAAPNSATPQFTASAAVSAVRIG
jgi:hypothetical protein